MTAPRLKFTIHYPKGVNRKEWLAQKCREWAQGAAIRANRKKSEQGVAGWQVGR